jgi:RND family efflux transporter MFP subunit
LEKFMQPESTPPAISRRRLRLAGLLAVTVCAFLIAMGLTTRKMADAKLSAWTEAQAVPVVGVAKPDTRGQRTTLDLPGRLEAFVQAPIFARVSGYLKSWQADIGTPVKAGQLLGEIDAPDLDQQIMQAAADLTAAQANLKLALATLQRGQQLITTGSLAKQDLDQRTADASNKEGLVKSAQANLDRLRVLEQYKRITAPFDGLVTARNTDMGALINAGAGGGAALFIVSDTSKLRAYVNVPQNYVPSIAIGTRTQISVPEYPGRRFPATVEASAQAVDVASGTTRMLLIVDNRKRELMTGAFATVTFELPHPDVAINIPASALIFDQNGLRVAVVDDSNRITLRQITVARDLGNAIEVASGLSSDDRVVENPPDGVRPGDTVRTVDQDRGAAPHRTISQR